MLSIKLYSALLLLHLTLIVSTSPIDIKDAFVPPIDTSSTTTTFSLKKRTDNVIPLIHCPAGYQFFGSHCDRTQSNRDFILYCYHSVYNMGQVPGPPSGLCPPNYLCVDGARTTGHLVGGLVMLLDTAYCVSPEQFVRIAKSATTGSSDPPSSSSSSSSSAGEDPPTTNEVTAQYAAPASPRRVGAFQAVLTDLDGIDGKPVNASSFSIDAQVSQVLAGVTSWRSTLHGTDTCTDCASVGIQNVPSNTQRIDVKVALPADVNSALLYLVPVS